MYVDTDISVWLDANISLTITPEELVKDWLKGADIATWKHFASDCWLEEARCLQRPEWDRPGVITEQIRRYKELGVPTKTGLSECNVIVRRHTDDIKRRNERWWAEICRHSSRDQISFGYAFGEHVHRVEGNPRNHPYFNYAPHNFVETDYAKENNI
jgi:hypothetical protein